MHRPDPHSRLSVHLFLPLLLPLFLPAQHQKQENCFLRDRCSPVAALYTPNNHGVKAGVENWSYKVLIHLFSCSCPHSGWGSCWCWCYTDVFLLIIVAFFFVSQCVTGGAGLIHIWHIRNRSLNSVQYSVIYRPQLRLCAHPVAAFPSKVAMWLQFPAYVLTQYWCSLGSETGSRCNENPGKFTDWVTPV